MGEFKKGTIDEVLAPEVIFRDGKFNHPGSFYVQVTYYDYQGKHVEDAVMKFTGNSLSVRGGRGTFSLIRSDGSTIDVSLLTNPNDLFADELDSIKVYDVPENNNGTASVNGLNSLHSSNQADIIFDDSLKQKISMKSILNETYDINDDTILYEEKINEENSSLFSTFKEGSESGSDSIISSINEINSILKETNSERFFSGVEAQKEIKKIATLNENIGIFKNRFSSIENSTFRNKIEEYNDKLNKLRTKTRLNLLKKKITEINLKNILVEETKEKVTDGGKNTSYYSDKKYRIDITYETKLVNLMVNFAKYTKITRKYICLQFEEGDSYTTLENLIESVGQTLPYDKERIVKE